MFSSIRNKLIGDGIALIPGVNFVIAGLRCKNAIEMSKSNQKIQLIYQRKLETDPGTNLPPQKLIKSTKILKEALCGITLMIPILGPMLIVSFESLQFILKSKKNEKTITKHPDSPIVPKFSKDEIAEAEKKTPASIPMEIGNEDFFGFKSISGFQTKLSGGYVRAENELLVVDPKIELDSVANAKVTLNEILKSGNPNKIAEIPKNERLLFLNAQEYKIHLMPKPEKMKEVISRMIELFDNDPDLKYQITQYKVLIGEKNNPASITCEDASEGYFPRIVIYTESKQAGKSVLNAIYNAFKDDAEELGEKDMRPRYNKKINSLIYYAQGSGGIKNNAKDSGISGEIFEKDLALFKGQYPGEHALTIDNQENTD